MPITLTALPIFNKGKIERLVLKTHLSGVVCDGSHTFDELYEHRATLFLALIASIKTGGVDCAWKSKLHHDGSMFEGYFIIGLFTNPGEQMTYHLPMKDWERTNFVKELPTAPVFDGHTPNDVLNRLALFSNMLIGNV